MRFLCLHGLGTNSQVLSPAAGNHAIADADKVFEAQTGCAPSTVKLGSAGVELY